MSTFHELILTDFFYFKQKRQISMIVKLKQLSSSCSKNEKIIKLTVNTGPVMFSGEIYYYWPLNSSEKVDKIIGKTSLFFA